jgi:hypothetical protein
MDDERIYAAACAYVGADPERVIKRRIEGDQVILIVNNGILGCPKYTIPLSDLDLTAYTDVEDLGDDVVAEKLAEAINTRLYDATPAALVLADKHKIDLATVHGTGVGGRITKRDVESLSLALVDDGEVT